MLVNNTYETYISKRGDQECLKTYLVGRKMIRGVSDVGFPIFADKDADFAF